MDDADPLKIEIPPFLKRQTEANEPTCADCRFMVIDDKNMVCRRYPPTACIVMVPAPMKPQFINGKVQQQMGMAPQAMAAWPIVTKDWRCFEHEPALPSPKLDMFKYEPVIGPSLEPHPSTLPRMEGDDRE
jgi:hypothetical protein